MTQTTTSPGQLLNAAPCHTVLSTTDLRRAQTFWTTKCGLRLVDASPGVIHLEAGNNTRIQVYERGEAPKATNTVAGFVVQDLEGTMAALRANGIRFEDYDIPGLKTQNGIWEAPEGGHRAAWFCDPDGNTICISVG